ncbi:MAG: efflux RND transporter periplasmic adaptor subunit [candidate division Zixibacteria bacterium]|nr:efflux RND transporter periplasmic adaptor subunit [candidate division Zixibacteria bacterium]
MKEKTALLAAITLLAVTFAGCSNEIETRNMQQIYAEEGVPVTVETIAARPFSKTSEYTGVLTGIRESSAYAAIADRVETIHYKVGDRVKRDNIVLEFPTNNPSAQYFQAKTSFENAEASFRRMESYFESGGLSRQDYDNARAQYKVAQANWDAVRQAVQVRAPISGVLTRLNVCATDNIDKEQELFAITDMDRMKVRFWVPERQITGVTVGQPARATWNGNALDGKVVQVDISLNFSRQAFGVVAEFENPGGDMGYSGVTVTVHLETYRSDNTVAVERKNISSIQNNPYVYVAVDGKAEKQPVILGPTSGTDVEILAGLKAGDMLIVETQMLLDTGTPVKVVNAESPQLTSLSEDDS